MLSVLVIDTSRLGHHYREEEQQGRFETVTLALVNVCCPFVRTKPVHNGIEEFILHKCGSGIDDGTCRGRYVVFCKDGECESGIAVLRCDVLQLR
jgi:hypothetical protein